MDDWENRITRLVNRVIDSGVVPFVGAGFSYGAEHPNGWSSAQSHMMDLLRAHLDKTLSDCRREVPRNCDDVHEREKEVGFGIAARTLRELFCSDTSSLARWAELVGVLHSPTKVCDVLQIDQYAELRPRPSHRYLAYLAREGLIREVITTNYDCCIETAFAQSKGFNGSGSVVPIRCLEEYRRLAGRHARGGNLLVYKINGCAEEYADAKRQAEAHPGPANEERRDAVARRIILTERQLQNFRREHWARDLFRDRARSRSLLFSGFGSEEPQIRHTALTLMEEFADQYKDGSGMPEWEIPDLPNVPFIQVHGTELSFYQLQILLAFWDAHRCPHLTEAYPERRIEPMLATVFSGSDACAPDLSEGGAKELEPKLDAGLFLRALFERVFCRLVTRELEDSVLSSWLRQHTGEHRLWLAHLDQSLGLDDPKGFLRKALLKPAEPCGHPLTLWRMLWVMFFPERPEPPKGWYLSLREEPLVILVTLLLISFQRAAGDFGKSGPDGTVRADPPHGLAVEVKTDDSGNRSVKVHLVAEASLMEARERGSERREDRLLRVIAVPSLRGTQPSGRWVSECTGERHKKLVCGLRVVVAAADVIRRARTPQHFGEALLWSFADSRPKPAARLRRKSCIEGSSS